MTGAGIRSEAEAAHRGAGQPLLEGGVLAERRGQRDEAVFLDDVPVHPHGRDGDSRHHEPDEYCYGRDKSAQKGVLGCRGGSAILRGPPGGEKAGNKVGPP